MFNRHLGALVMALTLLAARTEAQSALVVFEASLPTIPPTMQIYQLAAEDRTPATSNTARLFMRVEPGLVLQADAQRDPRGNFVVARDPSATTTVRAWVDAFTGDAQLYPHLGGVSSPHSSAIRSRAQVASAAAPALSELITIDDTTALIGEPRVLIHSRAHRVGSNVVLETAPQLFYVPARRRVDGYDVDGQGSRAMVVIDADGVVRGAARKWKKATRSRAVNAALRAAQLQAEITAQVEARRVQQNAARAYVSDVRLIYYDGHTGILQPAFRFTARFEPDSSQAGADWPAYAVGYVPFAAANDAEEHLPSFSGDAQLRAPTVAPAASSVDNTATMVPPGEIHVHRYVARNADPGFTLSADQFWDALAGSALGSRFRDSQFFYSEPRLFSGPIDSFVNGAQVVLAEGHGRRATMATNNTRELVEFGEVSGGYGAGGRGSLDHLILHACSIFGPEADEAASSAEWTHPWWSLFDGGMTSAVGYRSLMYISDGATLGFAERLGAEAPVVSSWFNEVASLPAYGDNPYGCDAHLSKPFGRAAAVSRCDFHGTISDRAAAQSTDCLDGWWFADSLEQPENSAHPACDPACETGGGRYCADPPVDDEQPELPE